HYSTVWWTASSGTGDGDTPGVWVNGAQRAGIILACPRPLPLSAGAGTLMSSWRGSVARTRSAMTEIDLYPPSTLVDVDGVWVGSSRLPRRADVRRWVSAVCGP